MRMSEITVLINSVPINDDIASNIVIIPVIVIIIDIHHHQYNRNVFMPIIAVINITRTIITIIALVATNAIIIINLSTSTSAS